MSATTYRIKLEDHDSDCKGIVCKGAVQVAQFTVIAEDEILVGGMPTTDRNRKHYNVFYQFCVDANTTIQDFIQNQLKEVTNVE